MLQHGWELVITHPIHLHCVFFHSLQLECTPCAALQKACHLILSIRHCSGQPGLRCSLRQAHWQGSHGLLALGTVLRSDLVACCLWPTVSKAVSPKYLFPGFPGVPPAPPPRPAAHFAFAEGTPQCRSCPSAPSGHRDCGLGEPSCPQKSCCRGVINIPIAHVPCWLASRDKCSAHVPVERGDFPGLIQCFPFLLSYTPISVEAMNMSCWISVHPANFPFSQGEIFIIQQSSHHAVQLVEDIQ